MSRITLVPASVKAGSRTARTLCVEVGSSAARVQSLPMPSGLKTDVAGQLSKIGGSLMRASASFASQSSWLSHRATLGLLADSPAGFVLDLTEPPLLSPHAPKPGAKPNEKDPGFLAGLGAGLKDLGEGVLRTGAAVNYVNPLYHLAPDSAMPFKATQKKWNKELLEGLKWASKHPDQFLEAAGKDLVAYNEHAKGHHRFGGGKNTIAILEIFVAPAKIAKVGKTMSQTAKANRASSEAARLSGSARAELDNAISRRRTEEGRVIVKRDTESNADFETRKRLHEMQRNTAKLEWRAAKRDAYEANKRLREAQQRASEAAAAAQRARDELNAKIKENLHEKVTQPIDRNTAHEAFEAEREKQEERRRERQGR